ncbi:hypothetical protein J6590_005520 [Homalodisca vitripennis]|nr:hypothetical protein J6590_005520 [Homalodisca vitripennis]
MFPRYMSHYSRNSSNRSFIQSVSSVKEMYSPYIKELEKKSDDVDLPNQSIKAHLMDYVITYDLKQAMPLPKIPIKKECYLRQLWVYNLGFHVCNSSTGFMCMWPENIAFRGFCEIGSCVYTAFFKYNLAEDKEDVVLFRSLQYLKLSLYCTKKHQLKDNFQRRAIIQFRRAILRGDLQLRKSSKRLHLRKFLWCKRGSQTRGTLVGGLFGSFSSICEEVNQQSPFSTKGKCSRSRSRQTFIGPTLSVKRSGKSSLTRPVQKSSSSVFANQGLQDLDSRSPSLYIFSCLGEVTHFEVRYILQPRPRLEKEKCPKIFKEKSWERYEMYMSEDDRYTTSRWSERRRHGGSIPPKITPIIPYLKIIMQSRIL